MSTMIVRKSTDTMIAILRRTLPRSLRTRLARIGSRLLDPVDAQTSLESSLRRLHSWGLRPRKAIDIGAYQGTWTDVFKKQFPDTSVLMLEAQDRCLGDLKSTASRHTGVDYRIAVLGAADGAEVTFNQMAMGSSVFEENSPYARTRE